METRHRGEMPTAPENCAKRKCFSHFAKPAGAPLSCRLRVRAESCKPRPAPHGRLSLARVRSRNCVGLHATAFYYSVKAPAQPPIATQSAVSGRHSRTGRGDLANASAAQRGTRSTNAGLTKIRALPASSGSASTPLSLPFSTPSPSASTQARIRRLAHAARRNCRPVVSRAYSMAARRSPGQTTIGRKGRRHPSAPSSRSVSRSGLTALASAPCELVTSCLPGQFQAERRRRSRRSVSSRDAKNRNAPGRDIPSSRSSPSKILGKGGPMFCIVNGARDESTAMPPGGESSSRRCDAGSTSSRPHLDGAGSPHADACCRCEGWSRSIYWARRSKRTPVRLRLLDQSVFTSRRRPRIAEVSAPRRRRRPDGMADGFIFEPKT